MIILTRDDHSVAGKATDSVVTTQDDKQSKDCPKFTMDGHHDD